MAGPEHRDIEKFHKAHEENLVGLGLVEFLEERELVLSAVSE